MKWGKKINIDLVGDLSNLYGNRKTVANSGQAEIKKSILALLSCTRVRACVYAWVLNVDTLAYVRIGIGERIVVGERVVFGVVIGVKIVDVDIGVMFVHGVMVCGALSAPNAKLFVCVR